MKDLYLYAFWPRMNDEDENIAYGLPKHSLLFIVWFSITLTIVGIGLYLLDFIKLNSFYISICPLYTIILFLYLHKNSGWYVVNNKAKPIKLIIKGLNPPEKLKNRMPIRKNKFLERTEG